MKGFLAKVAKRSSTRMSPSPPTPHPIVHSSGHLQPSYNVPPVPHPCPHSHIAILVTSQGLLLRPHVVGLNPKSYVRIAWGKSVQVEELEGNAGANWGNSVIVYGIVGIIELSTGSHLLVITSRSEIGHLLSPSHAVYGVKGVTAIPLREDRARIALNTLSSRNTTLARPSLLPRDDTMDTVSYHSSPSSSRTTTPRVVTFASEEQIKVMSPLTTTEFSYEGEGETASSPSPASSGASTPRSEESLSTSPVAKTLANRLSFWSLLSKRTPPTPIEVETSFASQQRESLDSIMKEGREEPAEVLGSILEATAPPPQTPEEQNSELESKIIKECIREFTKGGMYFAYNFDITRSLQHKQEQIAKSQKQDALLAELNVLTASEMAEGKVNVLAELHPTLPLWRRVDRQYWWNEWLSKPFIDAGLHSYVLPIIQGYYQIASFPIPREPVAMEEGDNATVDYIIVSRRSRDRAGLRYQRRGIDDEAHVANFVETETIIRVEREGASNVFSYVQVRGSIPLFWTQSGYSLKPPPVLSPERTHIQNLDALKRHFQKTVPRYGPHSVVNLAEQHGKEAVITESYRECMHELNREDVKYHEYDFHTETRGMKYENISKLIDVMERTFESQGYLWISNGIMMSQQKGVFRVNCIDCLDRTNVVQSAFARHVMNRQLGAVALLNTHELGRTEADIVFNDVWANNGDAISRAYAGTSALKGDFTRTGKRDLGGMLNDGVNSLARMYTSTFSDWFSQAVIDFMLGYRSFSVFSEFLLKLQSTDPRELIRLSKIRAEAIATSVSRVLAEGERLLSGWTVFAPELLNTKIGDKFEEKVLLLTAHALYIISYDYTMDKVKIYTRVPLIDITKITKGAYILSPLEEASRDPMQNAGFIVTWANSRQTTRVTSYSMRNSISSLDTPPASPSPFSSGPMAGTSAMRSTPARKNTLSRILSTRAVDINIPGSETTFAAFKALPIDPARVSRGTGSGFTEPADELTGTASCKEAVDLMVDDIERAYNTVGGGQELVSVTDVVSLAEAQRMTSVYAKMEYGVKRLLWLGG